MSFPALKFALESCFAWTWKTSLQATVLIALVWAAQWLFKRVLSPRWRYALGLLVLVRLALPVVPASPISVFNLGKLMPSRPSIPSAFLTVPARLPTKIPSPAPVNPPVHANTLPVTQIAAIIWLAGCFGMFGLAARQQCNLVAQLRRQTPLTDSRLLALLTECKALLQLTRQIEIFADARLNTPALFGHRRPRLLIPQAMLQRLTERELRFILLHELTHLKRGDILANWAMIFFRSWHWFNPAVWLAVRRMRADQELACDAAVMALLAPDERRHYGSTLIKLLNDFSTPPFCPGLVPFITNKQIIKRRIIMIAKFKPAGRLALVGSLTLLVALGCFTFTRAAEKQADAPTEPAAVKSSPADSPLKAEQNARASRERSQFFENLRQEDEATRRRLGDLADARDRLTVEARKLQDEMGALRRELEIPNDIAEGKAFSKTDAETIRQFQVSLMEAETQYTKEEKLLTQLRQLSQDDLRNALPTAAPDALLNSLLEQLGQEETKLAGLKADLGEKNPELQKTGAVAESLQKRIQQRLKGILFGMEIRVESLKAVAEQTKSRIESARQDNLKSIESYQPFFERKRELENLQKSRDELAARWEKERLEFELLENAHARQYEKGAQKK